MGKVRILCIEDSLLSEAYSSLKKRSGKEMKCAIVKPTEYEYVLTALAKHMNGVFWEKSRKRILYRFLTQWLWKKAVPVVGISASAVSATLVLGFLSALAAKGIGGDAVAALFVVLNFVLGYFVTARLVARWILSYLDSERARIPFDRIAQESFGEKWDEFCCMEGKTPSSV